MLKKDQAICIRCVDFSESSQVVTLLSREHGKIDAIAKGSKRARSAFGGPIEIFSCGRIVFAEGRGENLATLTEFEQEVWLRGLGRKLFVLNSGLFAAELVNLFTAVGDANEALYDGFAGFLRDCRDAQDRVEAVCLLIVFQLQLLGLVGGGLVLGGCANCKRVFERSWGEAQFSSEAHGLICGDCEGSFADAVRVSIQAAGCLHDLRRLGEADGKVVDEVEKVLIGHFTELLNRSPKMAKHFLNST